MLHLMMMRGSETDLVNEEDAGVVIRVRFERR